MKSIGKLKYTALILTSALTSCEPTIKPGSVNFAEPCKLTNILEADFRLEDIPDTIVKNGEREYALDHPNNYNVLFTNSTGNPQFGFSISRAPILSGDGVSFKSTEMTLCRDDDVMIARYVENKCDETKDNRENFLVSLDLSNHRISCNLKYDTCNFGWRRGWVLSKKNIKGQSQKSQAPVYISLKFDREKLGCFAHYYDFFNVKIDDMIFNKDTILLSISGKKYDLSTLRRQPFFHQKKNLNH